MKLTALLLTLTIGSIWGQQNQVISATSTFYDTDDANDRAYLEFAKNVTRKLAEASLKEDPTVRSVILSVRLFGGNPAPVGRYRLVVIRDGFAELNPQQLTAIAPKAIGMTYDDYMKKASTLRKMTGSSLRQRVATTSGDRPPAIVEGDIIHTDLMKILPDRATEYYNMERNDWLPMHTQRVKDGAIKSWSLWAFRSPSGSERRYDAVTSTIYKDLNAAMANPGYAALYQKLFPDRSVAAGMDRGRTTRTIVVSDLWRVIWAVSR